MSCSPKNDPSVVASSRSADVVWRPPDIFAKLALVISPHFCAGERTAEQERRVKAIRQKLDRLDEAFLYSESIDLATYSRQRDKLREELTLSKIDHHTEAVDELDVEGILTFAERILPRASDLWVQASLDYKQRLQQLFFPEGIAFDGNRFSRTAVTAPLFKYLETGEQAEVCFLARR